MIKDLKRADSGSVKVETQVCIIGAGTAGIFLAQQLRKSAIRVVLLEAGDEVASSPENVDQYCIQKGIRYRGADYGRSFGLGGTSVLWGGQLIGLTPDDMAARPEVGCESWPIDYSEVAGQFPNVMQQLGLPSRAYDENWTELLKNYPLLSKLDEDFELRLSSWLPFKTRNFSKVFADKLKSDTDLEVWLNASVTEFIQSSNMDTQRISAVQAQSVNGKIIVVHSNYVVICAGALESTRLMLALDESSEGKITSRGSPLGLNFSDHLSVTCGKFECRDWHRFNMQAAPVFTSGIMRTPRLELSSAAQRRLTLPSAFSHFTFVTHGGTGFDVVRNILRKRQGELQDLDFSPAMVWRVAKDVTTMAYWRGFHRRLWIPRKADLLLQLDIEQSPNRDSCLYLSDDRDELGRKRLVIDWRITQEDLYAIRTVAERFVKAWSRSQLREIANLHLALPDEFDNYESLYEVYHPTGALRMGSSSRTSVVDANLMSWSFNNCYVSSTAVFPSAGSANPGLMHLALTSRLAEHLSKAELK